MNNLITTQLSHSQEYLIKDIAQNQIRTLIGISADNGLLIGIPVEEKRSVISLLLRDFSLLVQLPNHLFNSHSHTQSILRHELFGITYAAREAQDTYDINNIPMDEIKGLWRKITAAEDFKPTQLN